jgi:hypothetical protein
MQRLFRLKIADTGVWIIAPDPQRAAEVAQRFGYAVGPGQPRLADRTAEHLGGKGWRTLKPLLEQQEVCGMAFLLRNGNNKPSDWSLSAHERLSLHEETKTNE